MTGIFISTCMGMLIGALAMEALHKRDFDDYGALVDRLQEELQRTKIDCLEDVPSILRRGAELTD